MTFLCLILKLSTPQTLSYDSRAWWFRKTTDLMHLDSVLSVLLWRVQSLFPVHVYGRFLMIDPFPGQPTKAWGLPALQHIKHFLCNMVKKRTWEIPQKVGQWPSQSPGVHPGEAGENHAPFGQKEFSAAEVPWASPGVQRTERTVQTWLKIPESPQTPPRHRCVPLGPDHWWCRW